MKLEHRRLRSCNKHARMAMSIRVVSFDKDPSGRYCMFTQLRGRKKRLDINFLASMSEKEAIRIATKMCGTIHGDPVWIGVPANQ